MALRLLVLIADYPLEEERFLKLASVIDRVAPATIIRLQELNQLKNSVTRDRPACSIVPQATAQSRAPQILQNEIYRVCLVGLVVRVPGC
jgi:hypothetical protein